MNGKITLPLLNRIMTYDKALALAWICDLRTPIIIPEKEVEDDHMESEDDTTEKRLKWIFDQIIENKKLRTKLM